MSDLLEIRVIGEPEVAVRAVARFGGLLEVDRYGGPYPSRKTPELVRCYLTGRLGEPEAAVAVLAGGGVEGVLAVARVLAGHLHRTTGWHPAHLGTCQAARCSLPIELASRLIAAVELLDAGGPPTTGVEGGGTA